MASTRNTKHRPKEVRIWLEQRPDLRQLVDDYDGMAIWHQDLIRSIAASFRRAREIEKAHPLALEFSSYAKTHPELWQLVLAYMNASKDDQQTLASIMLAFRKPGSETGCVEIGGEE